VNHLSPGFRGNNDMWGKETSGDRRRKLKGEIGNLGTRESLI
jgi:hypothetical protein